MPTFRTTHELEDAINKGLMKTVQSGSIKAEKIIEKLNKGGIYNALELADIFNISIEKVAITCRILETTEKIEMIPINHTRYYCKKHLTNI